MFDKPMLRFPALLAGVKAVNLAREGTIGQITPTGQASVFVTLPEGSVGNGIRFNQRGDMLIADYLKHNILKVAVGTKQVGVFVADALSVGTEPADQRRYVLFLGMRAYAPESVTLRA